VTVFGEWRRRRVRHALAPELRRRVESLARASRPSHAGEEFALARFACLDLETTGPRMRVDTIVSIGAIAVQARTVRHDDAFDCIVRQSLVSPVDNILVHRIGGQRQAAGVEPAPALLDLLEWIGASVAVGFRAEFDATVLAREAATRLGLDRMPPFLDLAYVLPALFPDRQNDSLDDWIVDLGLPAPERHDAVADAYAGAQLLLVALGAAQRVGLRTTADLLDLERAQRWLGKRR
jgi:DNA polymerase-3 subunit epsilon